MLLPQSLVAVPVWPSSFLDCAGISPAGEERSKKGVFAAQGTMTCCDPARPVGSGMPSVEAEEREKKGKPKRKDCERELERV